MKPKVWERIQRKRKEKQEAADRQIAMRYHDNIDFEFAKRAIEHVFSLMDN